MSKRKKGHIYCLHAPVNGLTKIGSSLLKTSGSGGWRTRTNSLISGSPVPLVVLAVVPAEDCRASEKKMHEELKEYRRHGEWFQLPKELFERVRARGIVE